MTKHRRRWAWLFSGIATLKRWSFAIVGHLGALTVLAVTGAVFLSLNLDNILKRAVERHASELVGARVTAGKVSISTASRTGPLNRLKASITRLRVHNPRGFHTDEALTLGRVAIRFDTDTLLRNPMVIRDIVISSLSVTYEVGLDGSNLDTIDRNIEAYIRDAGRHMSAGAEWFGMLKFGKPRFVVENIIIRDAKVSISPRMLHGLALTTEIPDIRLRGVGRKKGGATIGEISAVLMDAVSSGVGETAAQIKLGAAARDDTEIVAHLDR